MVVIRSVKSTKLFRVTEHALSLLYVRPGVTTFLASKRSLSVPSLGVLSLSTYVEP